MMCLKGSSPPHPSKLNDSFAVDPSLRNILTLSNNMRRGHTHFINSKNTLEVETCFFILYLSYLILKYQELGCFIEYYYHRAVKWAFS